VKYRYADGAMPGDAYSASYYFPNIRIHFQSDHDVGVTDIVTPETVEGFGSIPVRIEVKNEGKFAETFPVNVQIMAPPVGVMSEDFEGTYGIRPNPPAGWLVKDMNLDGYFSGVYAYNMWGSYYSSSYANSGTMSMRCEDGGSGGNDDWLFTGPLSLTAGNTYTLEWFDRMSSSSASYDNQLFVWIGATQDDTGMTTMLYSDTAMYHTSHTQHTLTFGITITQDYYIGFHRNNGYSYSDMYLDDVQVYIPGGAIYDQTVTMTNLGVGAVSEANLPDWNVATAGIYTVIASTLLTGDENAMNDVMTQETEVGLFDGSLTSIDFPQELMGPASFNPAATVNNTGDMDFNSLLPVHATVLDPFGGTDTVFEEEFEGSTSFYEFEGDIGVEFNSHDAIWKDGDLVGAPGTIIWPDDEPQFGDPSDWTILNPDNNGAMWHQTDYRSSPNSPTNSMYAGDENTKLYLPSSQDVMISPKIHVGTAGGSFGFDIYNDVEAGWDYVYFGASPDGISFAWYWFGPSSWATWMTGTVPIPSSFVDTNGDCYIGFMFLSDSIINYEGVYIDHFSVVGSPYLYDETVYVTLAAGAETQVTFPTFTPQDGYTGYYDISICCESPKDSVPGNDCETKTFTCNAPVWNERTGLGYATIQEAIDAPSTLDGDTIKVNDGTFNENIIINKSITVSGLNQPVTGTSYLIGTVDIVADNVILEKLYVHPLEVFNHSQAAIAIYSNNVIVRNNTVEIAGATDGTIKGIHAYATPSEFTQNIEIIDNCVHDVVNCGGTGGGGDGDEFFFDFENNDGGWTVSGVTDWEWTNTYDSSCYVPGAYPTNEAPPPTAYSGTGLWGTVICGPYTNSGSETILSKTFDFTGMTDVILEFWSWENINGAFDYAEVYVNGYLEWGPSYDYPGTTWQQRMVDLSAYDGMSSVEIEFSMHASTVVEKAGWYIDDVAITSLKSRFGDGAKATLLEEGFEGGVIPPTGWIHNQYNPVETWQIETWDPHSGTYYANCLYDSTYTDIQDEWLISPSMDLSTYTNTELSFWWYGSYYWSVSPYDNYDLIVYVSTSGSSGPWTQIWDEHDHGTFDNWIWYNEILSLSAYDGESDVRLGFNYYGYDGAEFAIDDILVTGEEGNGDGDGGPGGAVGIMAEGATWEVDILRNEVYDVHSSGWAYGIEVKPAALDPETAHFQNYLNFEEDFTGVATGALPTGWTRTHSNWGAYPSSYSGGVSPEMRFSWTPSSTSDFYVTTPEIDTTDFDTLDFSFRHYLNHYGGPYTLKVISIAGGTEYTIDTWVNPTGFPATFESYTLTSASHGVGASDFQLAWVFSGYSFNVNYWYFDNVVLYGEYDYYETVYPWPLDVNIEENHIYRINLGEGYPCPDEPENPGVMLTVGNATLPTGGPTPADASEIVAHHNWFDMDCFYPALAILNMDLQNCLDATDNYYSAPDGPGSFDPENLSQIVEDCITDEPADGAGSQIVLFGPVAFDPWLGLNAENNIESPLTVEVGEPVLFDTTGSYANDFSGISEPMYFWKFGDGFLSMEKMIAHIYTSPGTYDGYLRVHMLGIPEFGIPPLYEWDYFTIIVTSPGAPLSANAGGGSLSHYEVSIGEKITLYGSASGGTPPYTYSWDLGDGRIVQGQNPTVVFNPEDKDNPESATYTVTLTVIDANYDVATDTATVTVLAPEELNVQVNAPLNAAPGEYVTFQSIVTGGKEPYSYTWTFGDGITSTQKTPVHIYENAGTYTVTLTVTDGYGNDETATHTIEVEGESTADPQIKSVRGLFGVKATIAAGDNDCDWTINVDGKYVLSGGDASGIIPANMEQTVNLPLTFALGKVTVTVTANTLQKQYTAFTLGPLFLNLKEA
jgi:PKD repeat protein